MKLIFTNNKIKILKFKEKTFKELKSKRKSKRNLKSKQTLKNPKQNLELWINFDYSHNQL